jgi:hypothetical protein
VENVSWDDVQEFLRRLSGLSSKFLNKGERSAIFAPL